MHRLNTLDSLKGFAIICVILYHAGLFTYGYLGVEVFLVIVGYLTTRELVYKYDNQQFSYRGFVKKRFIRLWPLAILISLLTLCIGYHVMLPESLKNTCETAIGTNLFLNNFVQYITSGNYWDTSNDYKPLMHTWYIGVVMQFYVLFPFLIIVLHKLGGNWKCNIRKALYVILIISVYLYLSDIISDANKFYLLPARLFEFAAGGLIAIREKSKTTDKKWMFLLVLLIVVLMSFNNDLEIKQIRLLLTVSITSYILFMETRYNIEPLNIKVPIISYLGMASYSLYIWHQMIFAFYRYIFDAELTTSSCLIAIFLSLIVGILSYRFIETPLSKISKNEKGVLLVFISCIVLAIPCIGLSTFIYQKHGIVRDVPELNISKDSRCFESQDYNERNRAYDKDYPINNKKNILVLGNSYGRDWINILRESGIDNIMNISYHQTSDSIALARIKKSHYIFVATNSSFDEFYPLLPEMMKKNFYCVGYKQFGKCNGNFYNKNKNDIQYYKQSFNYDTSKDDTNRRIFREKFIDMMSLLKNEDGTYRVFTPDNKFYSHDCIHLTQAGAKDFAKKINIKKYLCD